MRIALLTRNFSRLAGGAESYAIAVAAELGQHHEVHVFCQHTDHPISNVTYRHVMRPCQRPRWVNQIFYAFSTWWQTRKGFDVVHSHEHVFHGQVQTLHVQPVAKGIWGQRRGWRKALRALALVTSPRRLTYWWLERARMKPMPGRTLVFASPMLMHDFIPYYPDIESCSTVITPGVREASSISTRESKRLDMGWDDGRQWLLFVANDYARKGLDALLKAMTLWPSTVQVAVVGQSRQRAEYEHLSAELGVISRLHFLGPRADVPELMAAADALVHPTLEDSFGMVVLEAMACGLPVVVSPAPFCGLSAELTHLDQAWVLQDPRNPDELANAVNKVLSDPALRQGLIQAGQAESRRRSWAEAAAKYDKIFTA